MGCTIYRVCAPKHPCKQNVILKYTISCLAKNEIQYVIDIPFLMYIKIGFQSHKIIVNIFKFIKRTCQEIFSKFLKKFNQLNY